MNLIINKREDGGVEVESRQVLDKFKYEQYDIDVYDVERAIFGDMLKDIITYLLENNQLGAIMIDYEIYNVDTAKTKVCLDEFEHFLSKHERRGFYKGDFDNKKRIVDNIKFALSQFVVLFVIRCKVMNPRENSVISY